MTEFDFGSLKKKKQDKQKPTPSAPSRPRPTRTPRTAQINEEKLSNTISKQVIESLTETLQRPSAGLMKHDFNRQNLLRQLRKKTIDRKKGTKLYELVDYFDGTADASTIAEELDSLKQEGFLHSDRNGWKTLTEAGLKIAEKLLERSD